MENKGGVLVLVAVIATFLLSIFILTGFEDQNYDVSISELQGQSLGAYDAPVTIVEWGSFDCPHCKEFAIDILPKLEAQYVSQGELKIIYKHLPTEDKTKELGAECAGKQGKFWNYYHSVYEGFEYTDLDMEQYESCVKSKKYLDDVNKDLLDGLNLGVRATPTFVINGRIIEGAIPYETFVALIDQELNN